MLTIKVFLCLLIVSVAATNECENDYRDLLNNNQIDVSKYCSNKLCIEKCCPDGEIFFGPTVCMKTKKLFQKKNKEIYHLEPLINYTNILSSLYKADISKNNFVFVHNQRNLFNCTSERNMSDKYEIFQDGSLSRQDTETNTWSTIERLTYCIDYKLHLINGITPTIKIIIREITEDPGDIDAIVIFETVGVTISSFFLLLVLIVHGLLPELRNLSGLVLMAYTFSLLFSFVTKLVIYFIVKSPPVGFCKTISPIMYFAFMSSMFWLSVISYDVWSGLRRFRLKRGSKREELTRFLWYGLYAWGIPLLITAIVTVLDNTSYFKIIKPPFANCFHEDKSFNYYLRIPIGILIIFNIVLFIVTVYNIWKVKYAVRNANNSRQQTAKFLTYVKLSVMMGITWCMELIEIKQNILYVYIVTNGFNVFMGVAVFYLFVWDKKNLALLCKKFNIQNVYTKKLDAELSQRSRSVNNTKATCISRSTVKRKLDQNQETDLLQNCAKNESTVV